MADSNVFYLDSELANGGPTTDDDDTECPMCGEVNAADCIETGHDDDDIYYEVWKCECGAHLDEEGEPVYDGPSDYEERMTERRQMGLCNF
tara:strand:- start:673 stop:945 length:273 start_codon:yes stop_codon:yes gene_type:complete